MHDQRLPPRNVPPRIRLVADEGVREEACDPDVSELDWSILMARAQDGDRAAYHRLLKEIVPFLRALARRRYRDPNDIEDAVQDTLLTIHAIRLTYDPARPFGPWLTTIANRRFVDRLRRQGRRIAREVPLRPEHEACSQPAPETIVGVGRLQAAIAALPRAQQQAVRLVKLGEMSLTEAAAVSGMSVASLKVGVHRALKTLKKKLTDRRTS